MRKLACSLLALIIVTASLAVTVSAKTTDERPMMYIYFDDTGMYEVSITQIQEIAAHHNAETVKVRDGLQVMESKVISIPQNESSEYLQQNARLKGYWDITQNTISAGYTTSYYQSNGMDFSVSSGEGLFYSISPTTKCYMNIGISGTYSASTGNTYIDFDNYYGVTMYTDKWGYYRAWATNNSDSSISVSGSVSVSYK